MSAMTIYTSTIIPQNKFCKICDTLKPREEFDKNKTQKDGLQSYCKICTSHKRLKKLKLTDPMIGMIHKNNPNLKIVGISNTRKNGQTTYVCHCEVCAKDKELFGDANFTISKQNFVKGRVPCGCGSPHYWSEQQQVIIVNRILSQSDLTLEFRGWAENYNGVRTKMKILCPLHGESITTRLDSFLNGVYGCTSCSNHGLDYKLPTWLYLNSTKDESIVKIGISNKNVDLRLKSQSKESGLEFETKHKFLFETGTNAHFVEQNVIKILLSKGYRNADGKWNGYTESFVGVSVDRVLSLIEVFINNQVSVK